MSKEFIILALIILKNCDCKNIKCEDCKLDYKGVCIKIMAKRILEHIEESE